MICAICQGTEASNHPTYGVLPCLACQKRQASYGKPGIAVEMTTEQIKQDRKEFASDLIQPYRDGRVSKEFIEQYGTDKVKATKQEIKNAKYIWNDTTYYKKG